MVNPIVKKTIRDKISYFSSASELRVPIFNLMSSNQKKDSAVQILSPAVFLWVVADELELNVIDLIERAGKIVNDADHIYSPHMKAIREYVRKELK